MSSLGDFSPRRRPLPRLLGIALPTAWASGDCRFFRFGKRGLSPSRVLARIVSGRPAQTISTLLIGDSYMGRTGRKRSNKRARPAAAPRTAKRGSVARASKAGQRTWA